MSDKSVRAMKDVWALPRGTFGAGGDRILKKQLLLCIARYGDPDGTNSCPSIGTIARACEIEQRAAYKVIHWLVAEGLLRVEHKAGRPGKLRGRTNLYSILWPDDTLHPGDNRHGAIENVTMLVDRHPAQRQSTPCTEPPTPCNSKGGMTALKTEKEKSLDLSSKSKALFSFKSESQRRKANGNGDALDQVLAEVVSEPERKWRSRLEEVPF